MTAMVLVSVINRYHISGLHLFETTIMYVCTYTCIAMCVCVYIIYIYIYIYIYTPVDTQVSAVQQNLYLSILSRLDDV